jgi:hypothetical protein
MTVPDIDKARGWLESTLGCSAPLNFGPFPVTDGPAAGQSINYYLPPLGHYLELISYPNGMAYEATAPIPLWSPRKPGG